MVFNHLFEKMPDIITLSNLEEFSAEQLKEYLHNRYMGKILNPPLYKGDAQYGPPEEPIEFPVNCYRKSKRSDFQRNVHNAHVILLQDYLTDIKSVGITQEQREYLTQLTIAIDMTKTTKTPGVAPTLYEIINFAGRLTGNNSLENFVEQQVLISLARSQQPRLYTTLWMDLWKSNYSELYNEAFFGLERSDIEKALRELPLAIARSQENQETMGLGGLMYRLSHKVGVDQISDALHRNPDLIRQAANALRTTDPKSTVAGQLESLILGN